MQAEQWQDLIFIPSGTPKPKYIVTAKPELHVDVWSGNHPFYTGTQKIIDTEGRVERFRRKYGMLQGRRSGKKEQEQK